MRWLLNGENPTVAFLFALLPWRVLGVDRFWLGETGLGVVKPLLVQELEFGAYLLVYCYGPCQDVQLQQVDDVFLNINI